jgi:hypothetical protein
VLKAIAAALLVSLLAGSVYEQIGRQRDRQRLPQIGRSVDIAGRALNHYCSGGVPRQSFWIPAWATLDAIIAAVREVVAEVRCLQAAGRER